MKKIIRSIMLVLAVCILWGTVEHTAQAAKKAKVKVTLKKGVLTISGKGDMPSKFKVKNKKKVKKVVIKKGLTSIPDSAFYKFKNLKKVEIASTIKKIGCYSFAGTSIESITIPSGVKTIGQAAFRSTKKMKQLTVPGDFTLKTRKGDDIEYLIADKVETVVFNTRLKLNTTTMFCADNLLVYKRDPKYQSIRGVIYSKDGKSIVRVPFGRTELVIEDGCEEFCLQSILYCSKDAESDPLNVCGLKKIVIPASVKKIEEEKYPAEHMTSLENKCDVTIQARQLDGASLSLLLYELEMKPEEVLRQMPDALDCIEDMYISKDNVLLKYTGEKEEIQIPDRIRKVGAYAFCNIKKISKVVLPEGVTEIGASAFALHGDDEGVKPLEVNLPSTLTRIGDSAFYRRHMKSLTLPSSVKSYGKACFGENDFTTVTLPANLKVIPEKMFIYCHKLKQIVIPDSVEIIEREAFNFCTGLQSVELGKGIKKVEEDAFMNTKVKKVVIHGSSKGIANWAFACRGVEMTCTKSLQERKTLFAVWGITQMSNKKQKVSLYWNKVTGADGYQIVLAKDAKMKKGKKTIYIKKNKTHVLLMLPTKGKTSEGVYGKIRPYKIVKGKKIYGRWTKDSMDFE